MSIIKNKIITVEWPLLHGAVSVAMAKCGQKNCKCRKNPKFLHGPYYRWTGRLNGKLTTKTITEEMARECKIRIKRYQRLQKKIEKYLKEGADSAPWCEILKK